MSTITASEASPLELPRDREQWWRRAVVYEVYPRSFADSDGDGEGDLNGLRVRLGYIADLGVDAVWIAPWYPSPMADGGYDVSDYCDIHPTFGTLPDAEALIGEAHDMGLRVIVDMVANHTSARHPWFAEALQGAPGSAARERYFFRDGRGPGGSLPPNNWISAFGGPAWTRTTDTDGNPGQWYLHTFAPEQPDLDWSNERVREDFDQILRFWFDRGVDGIRVDAAPAMAKAPGLPDADYGDEPTFASSEWTGNPHWDVDEVHDILRRWRAVGEEYGEDRCFVAEAVVRDAERLSRYLRPDELQSAFNFGFLKAAWGPAMRQVIDETLTTLGEVDAAATWVLSSHDETRLATRLGRKETDAVHLVDPAEAPSDLDLGRRRARAATLLLLALPGSAYLYQGEELGLDFVDDLPVDRLQDPIFHRSGGTVRGRDGSRVPMPWSGDEPPFAFTTGEPWLPMPHAWQARTVEAQQHDPGSMLHLVRSALRARRDDGFAEGDLTWMPSSSEVLDFLCGPKTRCVVNFGDEPVALDPAWEVILSSVPVADGHLPRDATAWLRRR
jgi:alpha-glucosidase